MGLPLRRRSRGRVGVAVVGRSMIVLQVND